jgi:hypothetical protein
MFTWLPIDRGIAYPGACQFLWAIALVSIVILVIMKRYFNGGLK